MHAHHSTQTQPMIAAPVSHELRIVRLQPGEGLLGAMARYRRETGWQGGVVFGPALRH